ncbi:hypothetical protein B0H13DRAFT_2085662 [Mycena leptocephala]|nr:hypothetical protein B0H13DRAFT_2085662 [Mycena leptocephala]
MAHSCWQCGAQPIATPLTSPQPKGQRPPPLDLTRLLTATTFLSTPRSHSSTMPSRMAKIRLTHSMPRSIFWRLRLPGLFSNATRFGNSSPASRDTVSGPPCAAGLVCEMLALTQSGDKDDANRPPWCLGHICRSWRMYVLGYQALWSSIAIPTSSPSHSPPLLSIETQLLRSGTAPLTVSLSMDAGRYTADPRSAGLILAHSSRWRVLRLNLPFTFVDLNWLRAALGRLDALETLDVVVVHGRGLQSIPRIPDVFSTASRLRKFFLVDQGVYDYPPDGLVTIPWGQITHFGGAFRYQSRLDILKANPNLVHCSLNCIHPANDSFPTTLPLLRRLCVQPDYLPRLRAPLLEELFCVYNGQLAMRHIIPFVTRSSCSLTKLVLMSDFIFSSQLTQVLRSLPGLTYLLLEADMTGADKDEEDATAQRALFKALTATGGSSDLCPNLTTLVYGSVPFFFQHEFFGMVESRFQRDRLRRLRVFGGSSYHEHLETCPYDLAAPIQALHDEGFDVAFIGQGEAELLKSGGFFL